MQHFLNQKVVRAIPAPKTTTANGHTVSAATYGSGGNGLKGIVDTTGYDYAVIEIRKSSGTAQKLSKVKIGFQSGPTTLFASCTPLSGLTSGNILSASPTTSGLMIGYGIALNQYSLRKRYMNTQLITSTTCGNVDVSVRLIRGDTFPPSVTGYSSFVKYNF